MDDVGVVAVSEDDDRCACARTSRRARGMRGADDDSDDA